MTSTQTARTRLLRAAEHYEAQADLHNKGKRRSRERAYLLRLAAELRARAAQA